MDLKLAYQLLFIKKKRGEGASMSFMIKELASVNLFLIWLIVLCGVAFLRIVKKRLED